MYSPFFAEFISRIIIICGIKTKVLDGNTGIQVSEFRQCNEAADTVMATCVKESDMQWQIDLIIFIIKAEHI